MSGKLREALTYAANYLDALEANMLRNDADMMLDANEAPSSVAMKLRAALQDQTERCPNPFPHFTYDQHGNVEFIYVSRKDEHGTIEPLEGPWAVPISVSDALYRHREPPTCGGTGRKDAPTYDGSTDPGSSQPGSPKVSSQPLPQGAVSGAGVEAAWERFKDTCSRDPEYRITHHDLKDAVEFGIKWQSSLQRDGWRPIETAPKDGTVILALIPGYNPSVVQWVDAYNKGGWFIDQGLFEEEAHFREAFLGSDYAPRYWMPLDALPIPPTTEEEGR